MKKYKYYSDPSHGWLEVPFIDIYNLSLQNVISVYSYRNKDMVYLEHDQDASTFTIECKNKGIDFEIDHQTPSNEDSFIRRFSPYY